MFRVLRAALSAFLLAVFALSPGWTTPSLAGERVTVFAAVSMKDALETAAAGYGDASPDAPAIVFSFAASSVLARQIEAGADAGLFISANKEWMDWLAKRALIDAGSRRDIAGNMLVIATRGNTKAGDPEDIVSGSTRIAMGDPAHVPAGAYAKQALERLGLWNAAAPKAVFTENVRVALTFAERGEVDAAIVYGSDLAVAGALHAAHVFSPETHDAIVYPAALTASGNAAIPFLDYLSGPEGQAVFKRFGFTVPAR